MIIQAVYTGEEYPDFRGKEIAIDDNIFDEIGYPRYIFVCQGLTGYTIREDVRDIRPRHKQLKSAIKRKLLQAITNW
jgi:hypothetical protein